MPADANIFQTYLQPPKSVLDYQAAYDQADARKNALQQSVLALQKGQMDMANAADVMRQRNALRDAVSSGQLDLSNPDHVSRALSLAPDVAPAMLETIQKGATSRAQAAKDTAQAGQVSAETQAKAVAHMSDTIAALQQQPGVTPGHVVAAIQNAGKLYGIPDALVQQAVSQVPTDPAQLPAFLQAKNAQLMSAKERQSFIAPDANTVANNVTSRANNAATNETTQRGQNMTDARFRELNAVGGSTPESEQQLNYWADVLKKGGSLPPGLARGPGGSAFVREVTKRAALGGTTPDELMANQAEFMGAKAGQRTLGTKQANIEMAATEAYNMMPIALDASGKVDRTNYPTLNKVLLAAEKGTGDENVVRLSVAVNSLVNSYSRAISPSGTPTVSDKDHAREILDKAYSKGQFAAAVDVMKQEIEQARKSPTQVRAHMRPGASEGTSATVSGAGVPPDIGQSAIAAELKRRGVK